jgi:hypothetical protein
LRGFAGAGGRGTCNSGDTGTGSFQRKFIFAGGRIEMVGLYGRKLRRIERRSAFLPAELDMHELPGHRLAQARKHVLE